MIRPLPGVSQSNARANGLARSHSSSAWRDDVSNATVSHASSAEMDRPVPMQLIVRLHNRSRWLRDRRWYRLSRLVDRIIRLTYAARIPAEADIHSTVHFSHNALAVVVTKEASIGARCQIGVHVLLGSR